MSKYYDSYFNMVHRLFSLGNSNEGMHSKNNQKLV